MVFAERIVRARGSYRFSAPAATLAAMTQQAIFGPFFATIALTALVWVYMYIRRIHFITANKLTVYELANSATLPRAALP